jgi:hypothetical protein
MFLTILIFPTALLQANMLVAMNMERADMWFNVTSLVLNIVFCFTGFLFVKNLTTVNLAIFFSFLIFHICQDVLLLRKGLVTFGHVLKFYLLTGLLAGIYVLLSFKFPPVVLFTGYWLLLALAFVKLPVASFQLSTNRKPENSLP